MLWTRLIPIFFFCCLIPSKAQDSLKSNCPPPSERDLQQILRQVKGAAKYYRVKVAGMIAGTFTNTQQQDYILWLNEQTTIANQIKRPLIKLTCMDNHWTITGSGFLPEGVTIDPENAVDVTGDGVLELVYTYSYIQNNCVDGFTILSLMSSEFKTLYQTISERPYKGIDWTNYPLNAPLPFVQYSFQHHAQQVDKLDICRFTKTYQGGQTREEVLEHAEIDSTVTSIEYDPFNEHFYQPVHIPCNAQGSISAPIGSRHPAIQKALRYLNPQPPFQFHIEGIYPCVLSTKEQQDFLLYSNPFHPTPNRPLKRKAIKITCNGDDWIIGGLLYVSNNFSDQNIMDVNGDGIDEIVDEATIRRDSLLIKEYRLLSFKGKTGKLLYSHRNKYTAQTQAIPSEQHYSIHFEDTNQNGQQEIVQTSSQGKIILYYDATTERYLPKAKE